MKQILVDMDGVLANVYAQFQQLEKKETGKEIKQEALTGKLEIRAFPNGKRHASSRGFFRNAPLIRHSIVGLLCLNTKTRF